MQATSQRLGKVVHISQLLPEELQQPVPLDRVALTKEEEEEIIELALEEARVRKHARLENERKRILAEEKLNDYKRRWSPNELWGVVKYRGTQIVRVRTGDQNAIFEPKDFQKPIITALSLYFTEAEEFEQLDSSLYNQTGRPFSLNKGIWLWGNPGVGKTLMMEIFNRNKRLCYDMIEVPKLCHNYVKSGDEVFGDIIRERTITAPDASTFFQTTRGICFNDLGTENPDSKHYGNPLNVMEYIVLQSYENKIPYYSRHVTTNLTFEQVKKMYGERFFDRVKECFNILEVDGKSLR